MELSCIFVQEPQWQSIQRFFGSLWKFRRLEAARFSLGGSPLEAFSLTLPGGLPLTLEVRHDWDKLGKSWYMPYMEHWAMMAMAMIFCY